MNEFPMMFPYSQEEFWERMTKVVEKVVEAKLTTLNTQPPLTLLPEKALLKAAEVCTIFQVSKPTLYEWLKQNKIASFKIRSRRYFARQDIEAIIHQNSSSPKNLNCHLLHS
ncbi:helix-turn-helix domain-containing protein [Sediminibacterium sp.]|uniref:helix-turn-helix domain-containing protein n=1 Tax=Sediminibacterium sp. TaxID=1917865 RepID=UPI0025CDB5F7|nr:helix-turn-helix domain-containing protein [Sediminibacterium sp.]